MRILNKRDFLQLSGFSTGDETVVIPCGETQLVPIRIDPIPDAPAGVKIHSGSGHRENPPSGETPGRYFQEAATVQCDPVVEDTAGIVPGEIEKAVVGEIDEGFPVTDALIANVQTVGLIQRINNADVQIPGEARFAVRTGPEEADAVREQFRVPKLLVKAGFEIRVEIAAVVVVREPVFNAVQYKSCPRDTVGMPADGGTEKAAGFILRQRIVAGPTG